MFGGDYSSAAGANMAGNDFSAAPKLINGKPRVISFIFIFHSFLYFSLKILMDKVLSKYFIIIIILYQINLIL